MDTEAKIILDDTISFCERDGQAPRLINILGQCEPTSLDETSLTLEAPTRFAYSYLLKQRDLIERYFEEITFERLSLNLTFAQPISSQRELSPERASSERAPQMVSRETPIDSDARTMVSTPVAQATASQAIADDSGTPAACAPEAASRSSAASIAGEKPPTAHHTKTWQADTAEGSDPNRKVKVTNILSPDAFQKIAASVQNSSDDGGHRDRRGAHGAGGTHGTASGVPRAGDAGSAPTDTYINSKFTFENFVYGDENKHAYQSAVRFAAMADEPGTCTSLFIYGKSGLGKTHLLLAIKNYLNEHGPHLRVKYANSQTYVEDYISELAIQKNKAGVILRDYHDADVLIIDDIQNIIGKTQSIENFFSLMDEFIRNNKKIAIASDRAPKNLGMDERLTSRFNAGMLCLVSEPGFEMKYMILKRYYEYTVLPAAETQTRSISNTKGGSLLDNLSSGVGKLTDEQLRHMSEVSGTNIRELESFCERCAGTSYEREQAGKELTGDEIDRIANEYFDTVHKKIHIDTVQAVVEEFYHVSHEDLIGPRRIKNIAFARHVAVYLANDMCEMTTPVIGAEFGGRDHTTVLNSIKVVEKKMKEDRTLCEDLQALRNKIILKS